MVNLSTIRQLTGNTVEELLFPYINLKNKAKDISIPNSDLADTWATVHGMHPRSEWNDIIRNIPKDVMTTRIGFENAVRRLIKQYAPDPSAKRTTIAAFETGKFNKPKETTIKLHLYRIKELVRYIDLLHGGNPAKITPAERRNLFFNTHPKEWRLKFLDSARDIEDSTLTSIQEFMERRKEEADRSYKKKDNKKKDDEKTTTTYNKKKKGSRGGKGRGGRGRGPDSQCKTHPTSNHTWRECRQNPLHQDKPYLPQGGGGRGYGGGRGNNGGRGYNGGRGGYNGGRGQPREQYYSNSNSNERFYNNQNGPPSTIFFFTHQAVD
jgi:hypothetical protein